MTVFPATILSEFPSSPPAAGRRILVTGASGFIGRALVPYLAAQGWTVRAAVRAITGRRLNGTAAIEPVTLPDLAAPAVSSSEWAPLLDGVDCVIHLAGIAHATRTLSEATYMQVNGYAVEALARAAHHAGVRRVILMSSVRAQSGPNAAEVLTEDRPAMPTDAYGRSKLRGEIGIGGALGAGATDYVILRPVLVYGPGVGGNMGALARLARTPLPLPLGALTGQRSLLSIDTLCDICRHVIDAPLASRATLLVADPGPALTVRQMMLALRAGLGRGPGMVPVPARVLRIPARLAGKLEAIDRLAGPLMVDTGRLLATGWTPAAGSTTQLYLWMQREAGLGVSPPPAATAPPRS